LGDKSEDCTDVQGYCVIYSAVNANFIDTAPNQSAKSIATQNRKLLGYIPMLFDDTNYTSPSVVINNGNNIFSRYPGINYSELTHIPNGAYTKEQFVTILSQSIYDTSTGNFLFNYSLSYSITNDGYSQFFWGTNSGNNPNDLGYNQGYDDPVEVIRKAFWNMIGFTDNVHLEVNQSVTSPNKVAFVNTFNENDCLNINTTMDLNEPVISYVIPHVIPYGLDNQSVQGTVLTATSLKFQSHVQLLPPFQGGCYDSETANLLSVTANIDTSNMIFKPIQGTNPIKCESVFSYTSWRTQDLLRNDV